MFTPFFHTTTQKKIMSPLPSPNPGFSSCPLHVWYHDTLRFRAEAHFDCIFYHRETTRHRFLSASSVNLKSPGVLSGRLPLADEQLRGIAAAINCGIMQAGHQGAIKKVWMSRRRLLCCRVSRAGAMARKRAQRALGRETSCTSGLVNGRRYTLRTAMRLMRKCVAENIFSSRAFVETSWKAGREGNQY